MLRNLVYMTLLALGLCSCHTLKPLSSGKPVAVRPTASSPEFIQHINVTPSANESRTHRTGGTAQAEIRRTYSTASLSGNSFAAIESLNSLQFKYGILLNTAVEQLTNLKLLETIDEWYGTRYRYGGNTKAGIDCSGFSCALMIGAYGLTLPRTSREQYSTSERIDREDLQQGDLVFFNTSGGISHVGVYLDNNKFVHASTSSGVMISDLNEEYYSRKYVGAGRVL